ncbi:Helix-turn-helix protein [Aequorivita sublithincola DSM 14238]|uniref:Helix-turn-helix protein n=1 Tax=Aequorivita sublithincola (strain DSM 14238 / LMG 21431 / ACAM 643 / 9-3) TaxID=746697 RepID=I3YVQ8_AEQSU|nr:helix-turn-helix transcriptional regulator [Aequorivita sublithincola]AFL81076.1 Helix-turn-helix protein [Aequorivita sublithincola DSM 14238]
MHIKLRKLREEKRVSQEEMGRMLSISQPQYQRKESGFALFTNDERDLLTEFFNVPIEEILDTIASAQHNDQQQGGVSAIYYFADKAIDEFKEMNLFLRDELNIKKEQTLKLQQEIDLLKSKLKKAN